MKVKVLNSTPDVVSDLWFLFDGVYEVLENDNGVVAIQPDEDDPLRWFLKPGEYEIVD